VAVEGTEELSDVLSDAGPIVLEEQRAEPIWLGAGIGIHLSKGNHYLLLIKLSIECSQRKTVLRVELLEAKAPSDRPVGAQQVLIEVMQNGRFWSMPMYFSIVVLDDLDVIFPTPLVGASMKEAGVLVPIHRCSYLGSLFPEQEFGPCCAAKNSYNDRSQVGFRDRQGPMLFNSVQKIDD